MKVAVCFSGHMRTFQKTSESFKKHLSDRYDTKVFVHTWDNYSSGRGDATSGTRVNPELIELAYKPTMMIIEPQRALILKDHPVLHTTQNPPINVLSKWCSSKESYSLCEKWCEENDERFDVVVSCRSDMLFHEDVMLSDTTGIVFTPGGNGGPPGTVHDYFAFGDQTVMKTYFNLYDSFDKIVSELNVSKFRAEEVLTHHLLTTRTPMSYCYIEYSLCRLTGEVRRMKA